MPVTDSGNTRMIVDNLLHQSIHIEWIRRDGTIGVIPFAPRQQRVVEDIGYDALTPHIREVFIPKKYIRVRQLQEGFWPSPKQVWWPAIPIDVNSSISAAPPTVLLPGTVAPTAQVTGVLRVTLTGPPPS